MDLCLFFHENAWMVWARTGIAITRRLQFSETTATELLLLDLALRRSSQVTVIPFTSAAEAENGADWEWCFTDAKACKFARARIQAKRLYKSGKYDRLNHQFHDGTGEYQIDRLLADCPKGVVPLYAFYNNFAGLDLRQSDCPSWGISWALATDIKQLMLEAASDSRTSKTYWVPELRKVVAQSRPWHELVCLCEERQRTLPDLFASCIRKQAEAEFRSEVADSLGVDQYLNFTPSEQRPSYYQHAAVPGRDPRTGFAIVEENVRNELRDEHRNVAGAVVFKELPTLDETNETPSPRRPLWQ